MPGRPTIAVLSHLLLDDIKWPDGRTIAGQLGGAGTYAAAGAALAADQPGDVGLVCGVGADLSPANRHQLARYGVDTAALQVRDPHTPRSRITYVDESTRDETPVWGPNHLHAMRPRPEDVPEPWRPLEGIYIFEGANQEAFDRLGAISGDATAVLWEIDVAHCYPQNLPSLAPLFRRVDWLSINLAEARSLLAHDEPTDCIRALREAGVPRISLRMGASGSLVADQEICLRVGAFPAKAIDPTGAGNAHGGALLATWLRTGDLEQAAGTAAAVASFVVEQHGLPSAPPSHVAIATRAAAVAQSMERLDHA